MAAVVTAFGWSACVRFGYDYHTRVFNAEREDPGLIGLPTDDADATRAYLRTLRFIAQPRISTVTCHNGASVRLEIYPEERSHLLDPRHAAEQGRIVARMVNRGATECNDLRLARGDTAYWWMGPDRRYPLTTNFYRIEARGGVQHLAMTRETLVNPEMGIRAPNARISLFLKHPSGSRVGDDGDGGAIRFMHLSTWIECLGACCESAGVTAVESGSG